MTTLYEYDAGGTSSAGNLLRRTTGDGAQARGTEYGYDGQGRLVGERTVADGGEVQTAYAYDVNGQLAYQEDGAGHPAGRTYDLADQLTQWTDALGHTVSYAYDGNGRQTIVTDTNGIATYTEYDVWDRVIRTVTNWQNGIFDPAEPDRDIVTRYAYDEVGNTLIVTDVLGRMTRTWYDAGERVLGTIANWDGATTLEGCAALPPERDENLCTRYTYDVAGQTVIVTDTVGRMTRTFYDALGRTVASVANWNPATLASPADCILSPANESTENICTLYGYDTVGNQVTTTNALDQTSLTVYDGANRPFISVANWDGTTIDEEEDCAFPPAQPDTNLCTVTYYDLLGRRSATKDPLGHLTEYGYDARGRLIATTRTLDGAPVVTTNQYDILGNLVAETDANGRATRYVYDELNRLVQTISPEGVETGQAYNAGGQVVTTTDGLGRATINAYDALGRLASVTDPEGNVTWYEYNGLGNQIQITNPKSQVTRYEYDDLSRLVAVIENYQPGQPPDHQTNVRTEYVYNVLGYRVVITNALGYAAMHTTYDALGRPIVVEDALGHQTHTQYNALGYRTVVTDANGAVMRYHYDGLNRLVEVEYVGESTVQYAYDAAGHRRAMTDTVGVTLYTYDDLGRLIQVDDPLTGTVQYGYDLIGNRTNLIYPDSQVVTYTYDADNRLTRVQDWDGGITAYDYDAAGQLITTTLPNGIVSVNSYDRAGRLVGLTHIAPSQVVLSGYVYDLDGVGNRVSAVETLTGTRTITYTYDALNRLTGATYSDPSAGSGQTGEQFAYTYDAAGNRAVVTETTPISGTVVTTYTFDALNRLTGRAISNGWTYTYTWSNRGQMLEERTQGYPVRTFVYDAAGRMTEATVFTLTTRFRYNGDGARLAVEVVEQGTTTYTIDYAGGYRVLAEETLTETVSYLYGHDCLGEQRDDEWLYYLNDAAGYVRQGADEQGQVESAWLFDPDGLVLFGPQGLVSHLVCGGVYDWSTGLIFKGNRYFDPTLGIWLSLAPLVVLQGGKGRKRRRWWERWYVLLVILAGIGGMMVGCGKTPPPTTTQTATSQVCTVTSTPPATPIRTSFGPPLGDNVVFEDPPADSPHPVHAQATTWQANDKEEVEKLLTEVINNYFGTSNGFGDTDKALAAFGVSANTPIVLIRQPIGPSGPGSQAAMSVAGSAPYIKVFNDWFGADEINKKATLGHELAHYWDYAQGNTLDADMQSWINWGDTATEYARTRYDVDDLADAVYVYFWNNYDENREWTDDMGVGRDLANLPEYGGRGRDGLRLSSNYASFPLKDRQRLSATGTDRVYDRYDWLECKFTNRDCKP